MAEIDKLYQGIYAFSHKIVLRSIYLDSLKDITDKLTEFRTTMVIRLSEASFALPTTDTPPDFSPIYRGLLILLSMAERKYRIEVGLGFEKLFPNDRVAKIGSEMVPDLAVQNYGRALLRCTSTLAAIGAEEKRLQLQSLSQ